MCRADMTGLLSSYGKFLYLKTQSLERRSELFAEYEKLITEAKTLTTSDSLLEAQEKIAAMEAELLETETPLAFETFDAVTQERFLRAADYAGVFVEIKDRKVVIACLAAYYVYRCTFGSTYKPCNTIILSKEWCRKYENDPLHKKQA